MISELTAREFDTTLQEVILQETGLRIGPIQLLTINDAIAAEQILPVLIVAVDRLRTANFRTAIYQKFATRYAYPYFERLLQWWQEDPDITNKDYLTQIISRLMHDSDSEEIWNLCKQQQFYSQSLLFARLIRAESVRESVVERVLNDITSGKCTIGDLIEYSKVDHPRVRAWFLSQTGASDKNVRKLAERVAGRVSMLPDWLKPANAEPNRRLEMYSTEVDLDEIDRELKKLCLQLGISVLRLGKKREAFEWADGAQWFVTEATSKEGNSYEFWFRAEDRDVIELVISRKPDAPSHG